MDLSSLNSKLSTIKEQIFPLMNYDADSELTDEQISVKFDNTCIDLESVVDEFSSMMPEIKTDEQKMEAITFLKQVLEIAKSLVKIKKQITSLIEQVYSMKNQLEKNGPVMKLAA